jgi:two-component system CheB/CheR fusion protein
MTEPLNASRGPGQIAESVIGDDQFDPSGHRASPGSKPFDKGGSHPIGTDVIDSIELPIIAVSRDGTVASFNPAAAALLSLVSSDVGQPLRAIRMLSKVKNLEEACEHVVGGGASSQWDVTDGAGSWFLLRVGPCRASNQTITGAVLTLSNVTALRASLEQAIDERQHTKDIINTVIDPLVVLDEEFRVQAANQAFYSMFQVSREGIQGLRLYELGKPDWDVPRLQKLLNGTRSPSDPFDTMEMDHEFPAIGRRTLLLNARRLSRGNDLDQRTLVAIQDITERKRAEEARTRLVEELRETVRYNEIFAGILAHDLRNPLGAMLTGAELLRRLHEGSDEKTTKCVSRILSSGERIARMIEQLLGFTRARSGGGISIEPANVDLRHLVAQIVEELDSVGPQRIVYTWSGDTFGQWDSDRLAQVISNLLGNAVEHGDQSRPIRLNVDGCAAETIRIDVSNAGAIPEPLLATLFDPFRGATTHRTARKSKGLGLGLFITKQVVLAHGGTVSVTSTVETGTTFVVQLPRRVDKQLLPKSAS